MEIAGSHSDYRFAPGIKRPSCGISGASAWPDDVQPHIRMQFIAAMLLLAVLATGGWHTFSAPPGAKMQFRSFFGECAMHRRTRLFYPWRTSQYGCHHQRHTGNDRRCLRPLSGKPAPAAYLARVSVELPDVCACSRKNGLCCNTFFGNTGHDPVDFVAPYQKTPAARRLGGRCNYRRRYCFCPRRLNPDLRADFFARVCVYTVLILKY